MLTTDSLEYITSVAKSFNSDITTVKRDSYTVYLNKNTNKYTDKQAVVIGAFDGLHKGHQFLINTASTWACDNDANVVVATFAPDPSIYFNPDVYSQMLMTTKSRVLDMFRLGVDRVVVFDFNEHLANLEFDKFAKCELVDNLAATKVFVGSDFRFGKGGAGNASSLIALGIDTCEVELKTENSSPISATRIRHLIDTGDVTSATSLLGHLPFVEGVVVHGRGEGATFGFPTANVVFDKYYCMPDSGVFAGVVSDGNNLWPAAINMGHSPTCETVSDNSGYLEANLIDCSENLYGKHLVVFLVSKISDTKKFNSYKELELAVHSYINWVKESIGSSKWEVLRID